MGVHWSPLFQVVEAEPDLFHARRVGEVGPQEALVFVVEVGELNLVE